MINEQETKKVQNALILKFGQIGDVVMAIPAVYALHKQGFEIDWICGRAVYPLLASYTWINPICVDDKSILFGNISTRIRAIKYLWQRVYRKRYSLTVTLYYDKRYRLLLAPVSATTKFSLSHDLRSTSLISGRSHADEYLRVLLGKEDTFNDRSVLPLAPNRLCASPIAAPQSHRRIAIVPSGASALVHQQGHPSALGQLSRRWSMDRYVALVREFARRGWETVLIGGPDDVWVRQYLQLVEVIDCIGHLSLPEVISVFNTCDGVISHDTGPLHLAGLSTACLVGIFGPTNPFTFFPRRPFGTAIWGGRGFACRPCYDGRDFAPCKHNGCMDQVTVNDVLSELDRLLDARNRGVELPWRIIEPALLDSLVTIGTPHRTEVLG